MKKFEDYNNLKDIEILKVILKKDYHEKILFKTLEKIYLNFPEISYDMLDQLEEEDKNILLSVFQFYQRIKEKEKRIRSPKDVFT
ncbi:TPA: hypothetical protein DCG82_00070, partial [candidate division WOR-3]|nr:hypothetical protein [candidate division WOR-3 bacterium]